MTPAFEALALIVIKRTGRDLELLDDEWSAGEDWIGVPEDDVEGLLHEFCHWVMAGPKRRHTDNYGVTTNGNYREIREERMCGWVEDGLYRRAGRVRPKSSVDEWDYKEAPRLRPIGWRRLRQTVSSRQRAAIVDALRLPGGGVGKYHG